MTRPARVRSGAAERSATGALRRPLLLALVASAAVVCAALAVLLTAALLARQYRPAAPWFPLVDRDPSAAVRRSIDLVRWHELGLGALLVSSLLALVCVVVVVLRGEVWRRGAPLQVVAAVVAPAGALMALVAWPLVQWQQVALRAVTVGSDRSGLWFAAFGDGILFVITDGREVSQRWAAAWLVVHLAGPALAAVAGAIRAAAVVRALRPAPG